MGEAKAVKATHHIIARRRRNRSSRGNAITVTIWPNPCEHDCSSLQLQHLSTLLVAQLNLSGGTAGSIRIDSVSSDHTCRHHYATARTTADGSSPNVVRIACRMCRGCHSAPTNSVATGEVKRARVVPLSDSICAEHMHQEQTEHREHKGLRRGGGLSQQGRANAVDVPASQGIAGAQKERTCGNAALHQ